MSTRASHDTAQGDTTLLIACGAIARGVDFFRHRGRNFLRVSVQIGRDRLQVHLRPGAEFFYFIDFARDCGAGDDEYRGCACHPAYPSSPRARD